MSTDDERRLETERLAAIIDPRVNALKAELEAQQRSYEGYLRQQESARAALAQQYQPTDTIAQLQARQYDYLTVQQRQILQVALEQQAWQNAFPFNQVVVPEDYRYAQAVTMSPEAEAAKAYAEGLMRTEAGQREIEKYAAELRAQGVSEAPIGGVLLQSGLISQEQFRQEYLGLSGKVKRAPVWVDV